ncbi:DoxX family protein [Sphingobium chlorophenolicum L-1]|uniref:DoxX family protein n=1 Tax=Sphingobium chlorophenolicum L-1 TaxID=690566 RepID=F6F1S2_SPHCR|nr:DoxX family membrane protein [Sphingobium chlorophenolicum]AEG51488.1 DoxX family protein [Sphingobium chlorophenolicum L-1]
MTDISVTAAQDDGKLLRNARVRWLTERFGRFCVAFLFIDAARYHVSPHGWVATLGDMQARGVPVPEVALIVAMIASTLLALALLFGIRERWAALGLALYTASVSCVMYNPFAGLGYGALVLFLKDVCIFGALLTLSQSLQGAPWPRRG